MAGLWALVQHTSQPEVGSGLPVGIYWLISSNDPAFIKAVGGLFQSPAVASLLGAGGYSYVCTVALETASVEIFRVPAGEPLSTLHTSLYSLNFELVPEPLYTVHEPLYSVLEERPQRSGTYGPWVMPPRPAFWQISENYYYGWLAAGLAKGPCGGPLVQDFYYYLAALLAFEPVPLALRPTTIVTEVGPYFSYPFRDVVGLRPEVVAALGSWSPWLGPEAQPTEALCLGHLEFAREAAAGVGECFGWGLHYRDHSAFLLASPTVPLECTLPVNLSWAQEQAAFGPQGHWSAQPWL